MSKLRNELFTVTEYRIRSNLWNGQKYLYGDRFTFVKNHFPSCSNILEHVSKAVEQLLKKWDGSVCNDVNTTDNTEISPIAYALWRLQGVNILRCNRRDCHQLWTVALVSQPRDSPWPLLYAALITIPLLAIYLENSAAYCGIFWLTEEKWMRNAMALSTQSRRIEDSLLQKKLVVWARDIIAGEIKTE